MESNKKEDRKERMSEVYKMLMSGNIYGGFKSPCFQFYWQDFASGTMEYSADMIGAYMLLLLRQWDKFGLPREKNKLARIAKCSENIIDEIVEKFILCEDGKYRNQRLEMIRAEQIINREGKSKAGEIGNEIRWGKKENSEPKKETNKKQESFFRIGLKLYKYPVSKYIKDELQLTISQEIPNNNSELLQRVLDKFDSESVGASFSNHEHVRNAFKKLTRQMIKEKTTNKLSRENCPYTDDQLRMADAQKASGYGTPEWFDKKWIHLLKN